MNTKLRSLVLFLVVAVVIIGGVVFAMRDTAIPSNEATSSSGTVVDSDSSDRGSGVVTAEYIDKDADESVDDEDDVIVPGPSAPGGSASVQVPKPVSPYSMADVATHSTKVSCWTTVGSSVYDVTAWINQHPGGAGAIIGLCGKDGTATFTRQHGGQKQAEAALASFKIGMLK